MKRSKHNLSHYRVTAGDFGRLYPVSCIEVLPGDTMRCAFSALVRTQPLVTPVMHPVDISVAHFFVPHRIAWSSFEDFITGIDPELVLPTQSNVGGGSLMDFMGCAPDSGPVNRLPIMGFNMIWNEFYRDQDLQTERAANDATIPHVAWNKDYFTAARPYAQATDALGESASITFAQDVPITAEDGIFNSGIWAPAQTNAPTGASPNSVFEDVRIAAGTVAGSLDINEWRRAMALQRFRENRNKFGSRYTDLLAFLGINAQDSRLQRPEYLGGARQTIAFSEVLNTASGEPASGTLDPLGAFGGHGIASIRSRPWKKFFPEHGYLHTMMSIRPKNMYLTASDRTFFRSVKDDFWQKEDEILGEQEVHAEEIYPNPADPDATFGYSPRHDDYRSQRSYATGPMRDSAYDTWHMARDFSSEPALNSDFITCDPTERIFSSASDPHFFAMAQNRIAARRLVSKYARN